MQTSRIGFSIQDLAPKITTGATCTDIKDQIGVVRPKFANPNETETVDLTNFLFEFRDGDGQFHKVQTFDMKVSNHPKSNFIRFLTSWLGHAPPPGWDCEELIAKGALITVDHKTTRDGTSTYAVINNIGPVPDKMKEDVLPLDAFPKAEVHEEPPF